MMSVSPSVRPLRSQQPLNQFDSTLQVIYLLVLWWFQAIILGGGTPPTLLKTKKIPLPQFKTNFFFTNFGNLPLICEKLVTHLQFFRLCSNKNGNYFDTHIIYFLVEYLMFFLLPLEARGESASLKYIVP